MIERMKKQKGITLIALIITIIVLLILAGVSINLVVGEGGILGKAQNAVSASRAGSVKEEIGLAWSACETEYMEEWVTNQGIDKSTFFTPAKLNANLGGKGTVTAVTYNGTGDSTLTYASTDGNLVYDMTISSTGQVSIVGDPTVSDTPVTPGAPTYTAYSVGAEVALKSDSNEHFYVIKASGEDEEKVTLLAKKNIDTTSLAQSDSAGTVAFSSTNYWSSIPGITYPYDLNNTPTSAETDAIAKAKAYGTAKGGTGRLMTVGEVVALGGDMDNYDSSACPNWINSSNYWLGSASIASGVWSVDGGGSGLRGNYFGVDNRYGVRPVIEISKSLIQ